METPLVVGSVSELVAVDVVGADVEYCTRVLHDLSRVIAWAEAHKITVASRLSVLAAASPDIFPEDVVAKATRVSLGQGMQPFKRANAIAVVPSMGEALADGAVSAAHVDVIANAITTLSGDELDRFAGRGQFLA